MISAYSRKHAVSDFFFIRKLLRQIAVLCVLSGVVLAWSAPAEASPVYGYYLVNFSFAPGCEGCHNNPGGGTGTVTKPFGLTMMALGLRGDNDYYLFLDTLNKLGDSDSDGDGDLDVDEVTLGGDPNDPTVFHEGFMPSTNMNPPAPSASTSSDMAAGGTTAVNTNAAGGAPAFMSSAGDNAGGCALKSPVGARGGWNSFVILLGCVIGFGRLRRFVRARPH